VGELSACIEWLFADEATFARRIPRAADAGLNHVEFWTWRDKDLDAIAGELEGTTVEVTSFVSQPEGRLVDSATHDLFLTGVTESALVAQRLRCHGLIVLAGDTVSGVGRSVQRQAIVDALRRAAPIAADHDVTLLLEPINTRLEDPDYYLSSTRDGLDIIEDVSAPNVRLLYDIYHSVVMGEAPTLVLNGRVGLVGHVHVADVPGRHEPGTGHIDWASTIGWLQSAGYEGLYGLEYMPSATTEESLTGIRALAHPE
jgi:hydroxypyruvate isomerase